MTGLVPYNEFETKMCEVGAGDRKKTPQKAINKPRVSLESKECKTEQSAHSELLYPKSTQSRGARASIDLSGCDKSSGQ